MGEIAFTLLILAVCAFMAGGFTDLYSFALGDPHRAGEPADGRALSWLGKWIDQRMAAHKSATEEIRASRMRVAKDETALAKARRFTRVNPYKLMGGCPQCLNPWVAMAMFVIVHTVAANAGYSFSWWWLIPYNGMAVVAYRLVVKLR